MNVDGNKFKAIIYWYGKQKGYDEKSYIPRFCEDFDLNYNQWNAYTRGAQNVGTKIIQFLMENFPNLNMNWFLKNEYNMWIDPAEKHNDLILSESEIKISITPELIFNKLEAIHKDIKKMSKK